MLYVALERAAVVARRALAFGIEHDMVAERLPFRMVRGPLDFRDPKSPPTSSAPLPIWPTAINARPAW